MALFIRRVETVVSLKQLAADQDGDAASAAATAIDISLGPDCPVSKIGGARVPKYMFAGDAAPKMSRLASAADLSRLVPDVDMLDDTNRCGCLCMVFAGDCGCVFRGWECDV